MLVCIPEPQMPVTGFRHECRVHSVRLAIGDRQLECLNVVGRHQGFVETEVNFMLTGRDLVVRRFDLTAKVFQRQDDFPAHVFTLADGFGSKYRLRHG